MPRGGSRGIGVGTAFLPSSTEENLTSFEMFVALERPGCMAWCVSVTVCVILTLLRNHCCSPS